MANTAKVWATQSEAATGVSEKVDPDCDYAKRVSVAQAVRRGGNCIADSLIVPPKRLTDSGRFRVLTVFLASAYGELRREESCRSATPFVRHMRLGGGMCAQAACFMATSLLHQHAKGVFGVPEITALSREPHTKELVLGGMAPLDIVSYFRHPAVGLWSSWQTTFCVPPAMGSIAAGSTMPELQETEQMHVLAKLLRAYVMSGMPVVLPVDLGRVIGLGSHSAKSIYDSNKVSIRGADRWEDYPRPHCVVVVGCHATHETAFLINDPAHAPFLMATGLQLLRARPYDEDEAGDEDGPFRLQPHVQALPVTPSEVRLPLLNSYEPVQNSRSHHMCFGLLTIAHRVQEKDASTTGPDSTELCAEDFRLVCVADPRERCEGTRSIDEGFVPDTVHEQLRQLVDDGTWCWVQRRRLGGKGRSEDSWWVWNAAVDPLGLADSFDPAEVRKRYLIAQIENNRDSRNFVASNAARTAMPQASGVQLVPKSRRVRAAKASIISSFTTGPVSVACANWPTRTNTACELYVFMQPEVDLWRRRLGIANELNALQFMAQLAQDHATIARIATDISDRFEHIGVPIIAIATFLPELAWPEESELARLARRSVRFLSRFVRSLQDRHPIRTVELVGGSLIDGIWPGIPKHQRLAKRMIKEDKRMFVANVSEDDEGRRRLRVNLSKALQGVEQENSDCDRIIWAVELEPGPLFIVRSWGTAFALCAEVAEDEQLRNCLGLNLDIAHWRMAAQQATALSDEITVDRIRANPLLSGRIVHAHIAGHHPSAHFGDIPLDALNSARDFGLWLDFLHERAGVVPEENGSLPFSGYVSLEFEAARRFEFIAESATVLKDLLTEGNR